MAPLGFVKLHGQAQLTFLGIETSYSAHSTVPQYSGIHSMGSFPTLCIVDGLHHGLLMYIHMYMVL